MATHLKFMLLVFNEKKDGKCSVSLRITKDRKRKYLKTGLYSTSEQWDEEQGRFISNRKIVPKHEALNSQLSELEAKALKVMRDFEFKNIDWTLNQFEDAFLNQSKKEKFTIIT